MVHVPILKIDIPEPHLDWVIPATVTGTLKAFTAVFDWVDDLVRPLSKEDEEALEAAFVMSLPREHRIIRKRAKQQNITDLDQISEDLEEATRAYYRRSIREGSVGFKGEDAEDVAWRKLVTPESAGQRVWEEYERNLAAAVADDAVELLLAPLSAEAQQRLAQQADARSLAAKEHALDDALRPPGPASRAVVSTACGAVGMAIGVSAVKLLRLLLKRRPRTGSREAARSQMPPLPPGQRARRVSTAGGADSSTRPPGGPKRRTSGSGTKRGGGSKPASSRGSSGAGTPRAQ